MAAEAAMASIVHAILRVGRIKVVLLLQDCPRRCGPRLTAAETKARRNVRSLVEVAFPPTFSTGAASNLCFRCRMTLLVEATLCSISPTETRRLPLSLQTAQYPAAAPPAKPSPPLTPPRLSSRAGASDDAVLTQTRDRGGVEAEPVGQHFRGVLAEQWRGFDFGRDTVEAHRPGGHRHVAFAVRHRLQDAALAEARLVD